jgi:S-adenosylmethionine synthetase
VWLLLHSRAGRSIGKPVIDFRARIADFPRVSTVYPCAGATLTRPHWRPAMPQRLFTSESVTEGHPDKMCDAISDAVLDSLLAEDPRSRVAVETLVTTGQVHVAGEVTTEAYADIPSLVRGVILRIGYDSSAKGFDGNSCGVNVAIGAQSPDIAQGVDAAYETRVDDSDDEIGRQGAGDQGLMFGYACTDTPELMPMPIALAHRLARRLSEVRKSGLMPYLRPDGKTQVTIGYLGDRPATLDTIVVSAQHAEGIDPDHLLAPDVRNHVIGPVIEGLDLDDAGLRVLVNPTGRFVVGGPMGDAGLTGRKIIVDTYGGFARHGGGAFSGKDPSKVDRSAAYAMRWVAKNAVAAGLATRIEVQVAYAIGKAAPVGLFVETFGTETVDPAKVQQAIAEVFDLRPAAIIRELDLLRPLYAQTAAYGHFGRPDLDLPWERTDRVEDLRRATGL